MYDETTVPAPEYRVRPVVRYIVTRYCHPYVSVDGKCGSTGSSSVLGEFAKETDAEQVALALCAAEKLSHEAGYEIAGN